MPTNDPLKIKAYRKVRSALQSGAIARPDACEVCNRIPPSGADGRSTIQAHHRNGYEDALNVAWLCTLCHSEETPRARGERNPNAKLSDDQVLEILSSPESNPEIAARFGIRQEYAWEIRKRKWRKDLALIPEAKP